MNKSEVYKYPANSAEFVVAHARYQKTRGRKPSMPWMGHQNPIAALSLARRFAYFPVSGTYLNGEVPADYKCVKCGATNCKLWREYNTFLEHQRLLCAPCCGADQEKDITGIDADGKIPLEHHWKTDQIGWMVPAVPTEERDTYWGYTSVPLAGCEWWRKLPSLPVTPLCRFISNLSDKELQFLMESPTEVPEMMGLTEHLPFCPNCKGKADRVAKQMFSN